MKLKGSQTEEGRPGLHTGALNELRKKREKRTLHAALSLRRTSLSLSLRHPTFEEIHTVFFSLPVWSFRCRRQRLRSVTLTCIHMKSAYGNFDAGGRETGGKGPRTKSPGFSETTQFLPVHNPRFPSARAKPPREKAKRKKPPPPIVNSNLPDLEQAQNRGASHPQSSPSHAHLPH